MRNAGDPEGPQNCITCGRLIIDENGERQPKKPGGAVLIGYYKRAEGLECGPCGAPPAPPPIPKETEGGQGAML